MTIARFCVLLKYQINMRGELNRVRLVSNNIQQLYVRRWHTVVGLVNEVVVFYYFSLFKSSSEV